MIHLGEKQTLVIVKKVDFGVYLAESKESASEERVLLPTKQVPQEAGIGDEIEVFLYKDSKDRLIATVREPKITLHQVAELKVLQVGHIGAFLDWGLEKDLLLPFKEQKKKVREGLVRMHKASCCMTCLKNMLNYVQWQNVLFLLQEISILQYLFGISMNRQDIC